MTQVDVDSGRSETSDASGTSDNSGPGRRRDAERIEMCTLLNCFLRETEHWSVEDLADGRTVLRITLALDGRDLVTPITYLSATARHQYALPPLLVERGGPLALPPGDEPLGQPVDLTTLVALLTDALGGTDPSLVERIADSVDNVERYLTERAGEIDHLWSAAPLTFIQSEQALLIGHQLHPTAKSRCEMSADERCRFSPELRGRFPLEWFRIDRTLIREQSATDTPATTLLLDALGADPATDPGAIDAAVVDPARFALLPAHPWEADHLVEDPTLAELFDSELITRVGPLGSPFTPTTSVRSVYAPNWPWMLKFSLHVRVTNSMRVTLPKELDRAVEAARLAQTSLGDAVAQLTPAFTMLHDPAAVTVEWDGKVVDGFSVLLRTNRWPLDNRTDVTSVTTLCQDHPTGSMDGDPTAPNRLGSIVHAIAHREGRRPADVAVAWFDQFLEVATLSMVRLYLDLGLTYEPHQQNTVVELVDGWPVRCVARDSQGFFHREAAHGDLTAVIAGLGERSESIFPEALADERLTYYLFINLTFGVINALGTAGVADEQQLLRILRRRLDALRHGRHRYPASLLDQVLDPERLPCKGNLSTRARNMDELIGDIATQSVYVTMPNPLATGKVGLDPSVHLVPLDVERDLDLVHEWMHEPHVVEFWDMAWDRECLAGYLRKQVGSDHGDAWIGWVDRRPIGYIETYEVAHDPLAGHLRDHAVEVLPGDRGWHILIGPTDALGTGAPRRLARTVIRQLFDEPGTGRVLCEPDARNTRMIRFCEALGHEVTAEVDLPDKRAALLVCPDPDADPDAMNREGSRA